MPRRGRRSQKTSSLGSAPASSKRPIGGLAVLRWPERFRLPPSWLATAAALLLAVGAAIWALRSEPAAGPPVAGPAPQRVTVAAFPSPAMAAAEDRLALPSEPPIAGEASVASVAVPRPAAPPSRPTVKSASRAALPPREIPLDPLAGRPPFPKGGGRTWGPERGARRDRADRHPMDHRRPRRRHLLAGRQPRRQRGDRKCAFRSLVRSES